MLIIILIANNIFPFQISQLILIDKNNEIILFHHILHNPKLSQKFFKGDPSLRIWNEYHVSKFLGKYDILCRKMVLMIHLVSGMPGRATELEEYFLSNTKIQLRTIFYNDGYIFFSPTYNKTDNVTHQKFIVRFMTKETSSLIIEDLLVVRPFVSMLWRVVKKENKKNEYQNYIFVNEGTNLNARQIRDIFQEEFIKTIDFTINFSAYRQCVGHIAYSKKFYGFEQFDINEEDEEMNEKNNEVEVGLWKQMGHSKQTARVNYGKSGQV
jgi:hypothetical protein